MSSWFLAIDFGTSNTCAAVATKHGSRPVTFGATHQTRMPSGVLLRPNGTLVTGFEAERQAALHPGWYDAAPKRSIGQATLLLGDRELAVVDVVTAVLSAVAAEARRQSGGTPPIQVSLTYPARWGAARQSVLRDAATRAGLGDVILVSEPEAAAAYFAKQDRVPLGRTIAVYDLGGGTLDVALLAATPGGFHLVGRPGGIDPLGGNDVDERLLRLTLSRASEQQVAGVEKLIDPPDAEWQGNCAALRQAVRAAKEDLASVDPVQLVLSGLGASGELSRADLRGACATDVDASVDEFLRTVELAGVPLQELAGIYLAGGSSRLPMLREALARKLPAPCQRLVRTLNDPKAAVALGAAELLFREETTSEPLSPIVGSRSRMPARFARLLIPAAVLALVVGGLVWLHTRATDEISGTVRDSRGKPLANTSIVISTDQLNRQINAKTDGDGHYSSSLPRGEYLVEAYVNLPYEGGVVTVPLARHSGPDTIKLPDRGGVDLDWDLKVSGERDDALGVGGPAFYGFTAAVYDGYDDTGAVSPLSALREDLKVTFRFKPVGPLVDGSEGKPLTVTRTIGELLGGGEILGHDGALEDIPLGSQVVTATLDVGDGTTIPLLFISDDGASWSESQTISLGVVCEATCDTSTVSLVMGIDSTYL
jgi:hypothetical protein